MDELFRIKIGEIAFPSLIMNQDYGLKSCLGAPMFLSPEVIRGQRYDFKSDVWTLGCILYNITSLNPPFVGDNLLALGCKILKVTPEPIPSKYSRKLHKFIMRFMQKDPHNRPDVQYITRTFPAFISEHYKKPI